MKSYSLGTHGTTKHNEHFQIEVKYRPSIPDNVDHWQVFEDDK